MCVKEENDNDKFIFSPVPHYTAILLIMCLAQQHEWHPRHLDFENAIPNGNLNRSTYIEVPKYVYTDKEHSKKVLKLYESL